MATFRPNWFLISLDLTASGQFSLMSWNKSVLQLEFETGSNEYEKHTFDTHLVELLLLDNSWRARGVEGGS
jgi:hypothetical protein